MRGIEIYGKNLGVRDRLCQPDAAQCEELGFGSGVSLRLRGDKRGCTPSASPTSLREVKAATLAVIGMVGMRKERWMAH